LNENFQSTPILRMTKRFIQTYCCLFWLLSERELQEVSCFVLKEQKNLQLLNFSIEN